MLKMTALALAAAAIVTSPAYANIVTLTGATTTQDASFTRALEDFSAISAVGAGVHYDVFTVKVSTAGEYSFLTTGDFDTFTFLYSDFSPLNARVGGVVANDDLLGVGTSGFVATLASNTAYTLVVTGYQAGDLGAHSTTIGGSGLISAVPEPSQYALFALGLATLGATRRFAAARQRRA